MEKQKIKNIVWICILLIVTLLILHNSMYPLRQSDLQSGFVLQVLNRFFSKTGSDIVLTQYMVRKLAHFTEYFCFGFLLTIAVRMLRKKPSEAFFFELFLFLAIPVTDETIQLAYRGRTGSVQDVLIDSAGCMIGMGLCRLIFRGRDVNAPGARVASGRKRSAETESGRSKRLVLTVLTVALILFIFHNSMFPGPQSGAQSQYVMNILNQALAALRSPAMLSEHFVRKAGHFTEYFAFGILLLTTIRSYRKPFRNSIFFGLFFLLLVPVCDELIQVFTPQRGSSMLDVLLDFCGGIVGAGLCGMICRYGTRKKE